MAYAAYVNTIFRRDCNASHSVSLNLSSLFLTFFLERRAFDRAELADRVDIALGRAFLGPPSALQIVTSLTSRVLDERSGCLPGRSTNPLCAPVYHPSQVQRRR